MRDTGADLAVGQSGAEPVGVIALVAKQCLGLGQGIEHQRGTFAVAHLAIAEQHDQWPPLTIADRMKLGVQAALCASDTSGKSPFLGGWQLSGEP